MVLVVMKWNIQPDKVDTYSKWAQSAIQRTLAATGVVEFRAYRPVTGAHQVVITYEFADIAAWATWYDKAEVQKVLEELHTVANGVNIEIWGPSQIVPKPIRP
jgi:quinol monooxygenase YgiN